MGTKKQHFKTFFRGNYYNPEQFINRDLSWWDFNERVLNEALDDRTPLLERLRFIDIFRSNTDEFYMKRIGPLIGRIRSEDQVTFLDGHTAVALFDKLYHKIEVIQKKLLSVLSTKIIPKLDQEGILLLRWSDLTAAEKKLMVQEFKNNIFPILTPLAVDAGHPFPFLSNLSKSVGVCLRKPRSKKKAFARIKIPTDIPQWIKLKGTKKHPFRFVYLDDLICQHLDLMFPGMRIESSMMFRVTRNAVFEEGSDDNDDLMDLVEEGLKERKFAPVVRLEYEETTDPWILRFLMDELRLSSRHIIKVQSFITNANYSRIASLSRPDLLYPAFRPKIVPSLDYDTIGHDLFEMIKKSDQLIHLPYQSYRGSVESFLKAAVEDPKVKAIKIVLYRTDEDGRLIDLLLKAAENKKQVACVIELKARFDEEKNIKWANALEEVGIHVSYGVDKVKTHAKLILVIRQEKNGLKAYGHIGTGNFNSRTARIYTDLSLITADKGICDELGQVFNLLTGTATNPKLEKLLVAPFNMHSRFLQLIENEIKFAKKRKPAGIVAKMNSLEDPEIILALYRASQAGVPVQLIVRGFCALKPGVKGLSDNITVVSMVGRFLEHHRIYYFRNGQEEHCEGLFFLGSADWMHRNLHERIEVITPVLNKNHRKKIEKLLRTILRDNRHLWVQDSKGVYKQKKATTKAREICAQSIFQNEP